jgi:CRISPR-associated protein Csd2
MVIRSRFDFVLMFDVTDGNPNGDPDSGNMPRVDDETGQGIVTDVCLKRKIRDFVGAQGGDGRAIFVMAKKPLNPLIAAAAIDLGKETFEKSPGKWDTEKAKKRPQSEIAELQAWLFKKYYDIRTFGAVMSTGPNAGQVRGPVQLTFSRSIDPVLTQEHTITRVTDTDKEEGEMGRKFTIPYGLYRAHGFVSAHLASQTGFSDEDLALLWQALAQMFEHDRSAARGLMSTRGLYVFEHDSALGNAPAHQLFERIDVKLKDASVAPRNFSDYEVTVADDDLPSGVRLHRQVG